MRSLRRRGVRNQRVDRYGFGQQQCGRGRVFHGREERGCRVAHVLGRRALRTGGQRGRTWRDAERAARAPAERALRCHETDAAGRTHGTTVGIRFANRAPGRVGNHAGRFDRRVRPVAQHVRSRDARAVSAGTVARCLRGSSAKTLEFAPGWVPTRQALTVAGCGGHRHRGCFDGASCSRRRRRGDWHTSFVDADHSQRRGHKVAGRG
mmetsp:Transcript_51585/g.158958  ORF Transcript_51585/g.158958 Transcript_51585/m.158958 type:complete len:208 (+) Transcript_51585:369-992(+)